MLVRTARARARVCCACVCICACTCVFAHECCVQVYMQEANGMSEERCRSCPAIEQQQQRPHAVSAAAYANAASANAVHVKELTY